MRGNSRATHQATLVSLLEIFNEILQLLAHVNGVKGACICFVLSCYGEIHRKLSPYSASQLNFSRSVVAAINKL